jgi:hypothetical protein
MRLALPRVCSNGARHSWCPGSCLGRRAGIPRIWLPRTLASCRFLNSTITAGPEFPDADGNRAGQLDTPSRHVPREVTLS